MNEQYNDISHLNDEILSLSPDLQGYIERLEYIMCEYYRMKYVENGDPVNKEQHEYWSKRLEELYGN